jgi:hypothetical protein
MKVILYYVHSLMELLEHFHDSMTFINNDFHDDGKRLTIHQNVNNHSFLFT